MPVRCNGGLAGVLDVVWFHPPLDEGRQAVEQCRGGPGRLVGLCGVAQVDDRKLRWTPDCIEDVILILSSGEDSRRPFEEEMPSSHFPRELALLASAMIR